MSQKRPGVMVRALIRRGNRKLVRRSTSRMRRVSAAAAVLAGGMAGAVAVAPPAFAGTPCTAAALISAITAANTANGTVTLTSGCTYTLTASNNTTDNGGVGLPDITGNVTIQGSGATIARSTASGTPVFRIFDVSASGNLTLNSVTISNGLASNGQQGGGGIFNHGALTVTGSTFTNNSAPSSTGTSGGGINNSGSLSLSTSTFTGNSAQEGGGVFNQKTATIANDTFSGNNATIFGGGALLNAAGTMTVTGDTFTGNTGPGGGAIDNDTTLNISDSTFSGNTAGTNGGGAIINFGPTTATQTTISGNSSPYGANILNYTGNTLKLSMSIVANGQGGGPNCGGGAAVTDGGYNIDTGPTCGFSAASHSMSSTQPQLGPLASNGGPTQTMALPAGSPAVDAIPASTSGCSGTTDQRGITRPQGTGCDVGAYELVQGQREPLGAGRPDGHRHHGHLGVPVLERFLRQPHRLHRVPERQVRRHHRRSQRHHVHGPDGIAVHHVHLHGRRFQREQPLGAVRAGARDHTRARRHHRGAGRRGVDGGAGDQRHDHLVRPGARGRPARRLVRRVQLVRAGEGLRQRQRRVDPQHRLDHVRSGGGDIALYYLQNSAAAPNGLTITISASSATYLEGAVGEYSGVATAGALDQVAVAKGTGSTVDSGPTAAVGAGELVVGGILTGGSPGTVTAGSSQGQSYTMLAQSSGLSSDLEDILSGAAGAQDARATFGTATDWYAVAATFHTFGSGNTTPPSVPTGLTDPTDTASSVGLSWNASTDSTGTLAGYTVYRNGTSIGTTNAGTTTFTDSAVQPSTTYSYTVDAFDTAGNHSAQSSPALPVTTPAAPPPSAKWVQGGVNSSGAPVTSVTITLTSPVGAGDLLVGWFGQYNSSGQVTVSDNVNGAWTRSSASTSYGGGSGDIALYYRQNSAAAPGGLTITITATNATYLEGVAADYSGVAATGALDQVSVAKGNSTSVNSGPTASVGAGEVVVGAVLTGGSPGTVTAGSSQGQAFTMRTQWGSGSADLEDILVSAAGAQDATATFSSATDWYAVAAVFHPA